MVNQYHCTLDPELHECPHLVLEKLACTKGCYCCFRQTAEEMYLWYNGLNYEKSHRE